MVLLSQLREASRNFESLQRCVLEPLEADLAVCAQRPRPGDPAWDVVARAAHVWLVDEPADWPAAFDAMGSGSWRALAAHELGNEVVGVDAHGRIWNSAGIQLWYRAQLASRLQALTERYDWFVITRSDFSWLVPHPLVQDLDPNHLYWMDGEHYGGLNDRHVVVPARHLEAVLGVPDLVFRHADRLIGTIETQYPGHRLNIEFLMHLAMTIAGVRDRIRMLPYSGFLVRGEELSYRWSAGIRHRRSGLMVKYETEYLNARLAALLRSGARERRLDAAGQVSVRGRLHQRLYSACLGSAVARTLTFALLGDPAFAFQFVRHLIRLRRRQTVPST